MSPDEFMPTRPPPPSTPRPPRFEAEPFRPDGGVPPLGLILLLGGVLMTAVGLGFVLCFVGQWMYLVIIFPLLAGALLGGAGMGLVRAGRIRSPIVAGTVGAFGGAGILFAMHYFTYIRDLQNPGWQGQPPTNVFEYIDLEAQQGVVIGEDNNGLNLGYVGSYIYFAVEAVLAAGFGFGLTRAATLTPFCRHCNGWKEQRPLAALPHVPASVAVEALDAGALLELLETGTPSPVSYGLRLKAFVCPRCNGDSSVVAVVQQVTTNAKGQQIVKDLGRTTYPGEVLALVERYLPQRIVGRPPLPNPPGNRSEDIR